jgi:hypothetical protein
VEFDVNRESVGVRGHLRSAAAVLELHAQTKA